MNEEENKVLAWFLGMKSVQADFGISLFQVLYNCFEIILRPTTVSLTLWNQEANLSVCVTRSSLQAAISLVSVICLSGTWPVVNV